MEEWIKKSDVLELLGLPSDILYEHIYELKGVWVDEDWNRFIPCSEDTPKTCGEYLVTDYNKCWVCEFINFGWLGGWANNAKNPVVKAWMTLPELHKR